MPKQNAVYRDNGLFLKFEKKGHYVTTCVKHKGILVREIGQLQKDKYSDSTSINTIRRIVKAIHRNSIPVPEPGDWEECLAIFSWI